MKKQTGEKIQESSYIKALVTGTTKMGKTVGLVLQCMGLMPWQKYGGVCNPSNIHLLGFDESGAKGINSFLKMINAPAEAYKYNYWNMQEDVLKVARSPHEYDYEFFNAVMKTIREIANEMKPGGVLIPSSLTTMALALERGVAGPAGEKPGGGMDQSKWQDFARQITDIRAEAQVDLWHCIWEAHIYKPPNTSQNKEAEKEETLQVSGKSGFNFPNNVSHTFRLQRKFGMRHEGTKVDKMYFDTQPSMAYTGRCVTENLGPQETDLTYMLAKLGYKVNYWGRKNKT